MLRPSLKENLKNKKIINALSGKQNDIPPVWLMRQAGRYLSEYRKTREKAGSFLNLCLTPEMAIEVTIQPITRFHFDAAIIFSDILVIPYAMGVPLKYVEGEGPKLEKVDTREKIAALKTGEISKKLSPVFETLKGVKEKLPSDVALIGFAGAPWTVATYMVEGGGSKEFSETKKLAYSEEKIFSGLIETITEATKEYLSRQVEAGAEVIQLFDSWSGVQSVEQFTKWSINPAKEIVNYIKKKYDVKIIGFPKGAGVNYERYVKETGVDGVSIDYTVPLEWAVEHLQPHACIQGNLDPYLLASDKSKMVEQTRKIIGTLNNGPFIFNLGHGILPHTPIENVEILLKTIRG